MAREAHRGGRASWRRWRMTAVRGGVPGDELHGMRSNLQGHSQVAVEDNDKRDLGWAHRVWRIIGNADPLRARPARARVGREALR